MHEFLRQRAIQRPDMIVIAGGALALASPRSDSDRNFVLQQIGLSVRLHNASRVLLMSHSDCGTYGGLGAFNHERDREVGHHTLKLREAAQFVHDAFPQATLEPLFLAFDGVFEL